jgi:hypothetical protein
VWIIYWAILDSYQGLYMYVHFSGGKCPATTHITPNPPFLKTETLGKWINLDLLQHMDCVDHFLVGFGQLLGSVWTLTVMVKYLIRKETSSPKFVVYHSVHAVTLHFFFKFLGGSFICCLLLQLQKIPPCICRHFLLRDSNQQTIKEIVL